MASFKTEDGESIHYRIEGSGRPAMVFIHGWCSNLDHWAPQARYFRARHRVLRLDRRGFGRSTVPESALSPAEHANDIAAIARGLRIRSAVAVAHAGGTATTLELARGYPAVVSAVVIIESAILEPVRFPATQGDMLAEQLEGMLGLLEGAKGQSALAEMYVGFFGPRADQRVARAAARSAARVPASLAADEFRKTASAGFADVARQITQPVLVISAESPLTQDLTAAAVRQFIPHAQFAQVVGSGHFAQLEVPDQVNGMIEAFVKGL